MRNIIYFITEAFRGFYQAKLVTFVSILTVALSLSFLLAVMLLYVNMRAWFREASHQVQVIAYLDDKAGRDSLSLAALAQAARVYPQVERVVAVDKKEAWRRFESLYGPEMLQAVDQNPFPASLELYLRDGARSPASADSLMKNLTALPGVEGTGYSRDWLTRLEQFRRYFLFGALAVFFAVGIALNFMISNSIKLTIYARKELISNMRFVGATDAYIKAPFVIEGMLQGSIGAALSVLALLAARLLLPPLPLTWGSWHLSAIVIALGALFGCFGSLSAVRKFLT